MRERGAWHQLLAILCGVAACATTAAACSSQRSPADAAAVEIASGPLSGKIGGVDWTLGSAESNHIPSDGERVFVDAYSEMVTPCTGAGSSINGDRLALNVPTVPGDYSLGVNLTETFYVRSTQFNYVATSGRMVIDAVTATTVTGGAHFQANANNFVDGQFQFTICP